jgi:biotin-(acetyl-CoA carboxylase) ligase
MAPQARSPIHDVSSPALALPPLFTAVRLREMGDAFAHAKTIAAESGAGTLVHVGRFDVAEFALVLEPEEKLAQARRAFYAGMTALTDALIGAAEPETAVAITWPDAIRVNLGLVGGGHLAWPAGLSEDEVPPWLVFGAMIRVQSMTGQEPGVNPQITALAEEGFANATANEIVESFARNFMVAIDAWQESGFDAVSKDYLPRLARELDLEKDLRREIDDNGDLLLRRAGSDAVERHSLVAALATPSWLDPATRDPLA